jgi:hypothetical protein
MIKGWGRGRKKTVRKKAGRRRSKKTEEGDNYLMWGRRRNGLTNNFTLAVYMQFLVAADTLRAKHARKWSWNAWSSPRNPSTSRGLRSNGGMENSSPGVRHTGNICCLLIEMIGVLGDSVGGENQHVKAGAVVGLTGGSANIAPSWRKPCIDASVRCGSAGGWTRRPSR